MAYWGWVAAGGRDDEAGQADVVRAGAALELLHIFALIHDDVMDESDSRRGQPSVHTLAAQLHLHAGARGDARHFGESIAVLVGDLAHAEADHLVTELPRPMRQIWRLLVVELVHGQSRDLTGSASGRRDLDHARRVARMKSGPLHRAAPARAGRGRRRRPGRGARRADGLRRGGRRGVRAARRPARRLGRPALDRQARRRRPDQRQADRDPGARRRAARRAAPDGVLRRVGTPELSPADVTLLQTALAEQGVVEAVEAPDQRARPGGRRRAGPRPSSTRPASPG